MIAKGTAPAVDYGIRARDDGRFEIVWKTARTNGEVETEIATAATAAEDGHYSTNPLLLVNEDPSDAPPSAGAEEVAAATGNEHAASSVPACGAYADGGFSGGNMERPALQGLLADIRAGRVDILVIYKVDRLTR